MTLSGPKPFYDAVMPHLGLGLLKKSERILAYGLTEVVFSLEAAAQWLLCDCGQRHPKPGV